MGRCHLEGDDETARQTRCRALTTSQQQGIVGDPIGGLTPGNIAGPTFQAGLSRCCLVFYVYLLQTQRVEGPVKVLLPPRMSDSPKRILSETGVGAAGLSQAEVEGQHLDAVTEILEVLQYGLAELRVVTPQDTDSFRMWIQAALDFFHHGPAPTGCLGPGAAFRPSAAGRGRGAAAERGGQRGRR